MKKWYDRIGNTIEMNIDNQWIKGIIVNLKSNFIKLNNHEKKMFLERFVKEIRVKKEGDEVMIESVVFWLIYEQMFDIIKLILEPNLA